MRAALRGDHPPTHHDLSAFFRAVGTICSMTKTTFRRILCAVVAGGLLATLTTPLVHAAPKKPTSSFKIAGHALTFQPDVSDYALTSCAGKNATITLNGVSRADRVNNKALKADRKGRAVVVEALAADELVTIRLSKHKRTFYVRCLPDDFPTLRLDVVDAANTPGGFYMIPYYSRSLQGQNFSSNFYIITDSRGTPIWYRRSSGGSTVITTDGSGRLLTQGVLNGMSPGTAHPDNSLKVINLDGSVVVDLKPSDPLLRPVELLPNGNLLMISAPRRNGVDFTKATTKFKDNSNGVCPQGRENVSVQGLRITEMTFDGKIVWDRDVTDLFDVNEPSQASIVNTARPGTPADCALDLLHPNHVSVTGDGAGYVISLRWAGVYLIDKSTATIAWKLGGSTTPASLAIQSDPLGTTGPVAQHGGYLTEDNRLLVFDNQLQKHILPRAVEYYIDPAARTAVHLRSFSLNAEFCVTAAGALQCPANSQGNAVYLPDGNVLVSWGNTDGRDAFATIFDPSGKEVATLRSLTAKPNVFSVYHAPAGSFKLDELRKHANSTTIINNGTYR
jgi:hypothetical protein